MHGFNTPKKNLWTFLFGILILGMLGLHLLGVNLFFGGKSHSAIYFWPFVIVLVSVLIFWHAGIIRWITGLIAQSQRQYNEADVVSRSGLHWHPEIAVYVKGVKQDIPHMGLSDMDMMTVQKLHSKMQKQHTHIGSNEQGIIHLKFQGLVLKRDIMLGEIFRKLGKNTRSYGANLKMSVNGKENTEYENYVMQDKDKIELRYE